MATFWFRMFILGGLEASLVYSTFVTPIIPLSFSFDYNIPGQPFLVPVTEQCETIHIEWGRNGAAPDSPNPVAPYILQVYTSNFIQPFIISAGSGLTFDWDVPFAPGTLYQICMFDAYGNSGGCWDTYTVIPSSIPPTCTNVTFAPQLDVAGLVDTGNISQYGFIDQCTDISLTPLSGTPPFTLTVAPALHPVYNITSFDMSPINWTVSLNWASPFFISLADSTGTLWSNGPLHAGGNGPIGCLAGNVTSSHSIKVPVAVGISFLALFIGALIGGIGIFLFSQRGRHPFQELGGQEPKSLMGRIIAGTTQSDVSPYQLSSREERGQGRFESRRRDNIKGPVVSDSTVERPPSYPQYSPAESEYITREINFGRSISTGTTVTNASTSTGSLTRLEPSERHYNPRGPLNSDRPRTLTNEKGSSVPRAPA